MSITHGDSVIAARENPKPQFDIFQQLKAGTADIHRQIEERVPVFRPGFNLAYYCQLVKRFYGFWWPLEVKLSSLSDLQHPELDLEGRLKSPFLEDDLRFLGLDPTLVRQCARLPGVDSVQQAFGCLYVLEGSTLGAQFISHKLETDLCLRAGSGASFFNAYGESVGQRWQDFKIFVTARVGSYDSETVVATARQTFQSLHEWLGARL
jgi:heme oxygenase